MFSVEILVSTKNHNLTPVRKQKVRDLQYFVIRLNYFADGHAFLIIYYYGPYFYQTRVLDLSLNYSSQHFIGLFLLRSDNCLVLLVLFIGKQVWTTSGIRRQVSSDRLRGYWHQSYFSEGIFISGR